MRRIWLIPSWQEFCGLGLDALPPFDLEGLEARRVGEHVFVVSGIGPASGITASLIGARSQIDEMVLIGIAGGLPNVGLSLGEVVQASTDILVDLGYSEGERRVNLDRMQLDFLRADGRQWGCQFHCKSLDPHLATHAFATVSQVTQKPLQVEQLQSEFKVSVESMEGAYVGLACSLIGVPFGQVRAISNFIGPRDPATWQIQPALKRLKAWLMGSVPELGAYLDGEA
ncbi:MAG: hypothetical protein H6510_10355 [Acidobacteria bacterium]|nr:hypothetical protein [Acidobacteriota bacterium]MCB9398210.1 hypothetical protein [Acidobacteriota bacterium]